MWPHSLQAILPEPRFLEPFHKSSFNDKKAASNNATTNFTSINSPLNLSRLVVITTRETASASEEVINGLKSHFTVTTIGDTTNGKPTGMNVWATNDSKYIFAPVTFELVNSAGQGGFYKGFIPLKYVKDDITHDFRDRNESCYKKRFIFSNTELSQQRELMYTALLKHILKSHHC